MSSMSTNLIVNNQNHLSTQTTAQTTVTKTPTALPSTAPQTAATTAAQPALKQLADSHQGRGNGGCGKLLGYLVCCPCYTVKHAPSFLKCLFGCFKSCLCDSDGCLPETAKSVVGCCKNINFCSCFRACGDQGTNAFTPIGNCCTSCLKQADKTGHAAANAAQHAVHNAAHKQHHKKRDKNDWTGENKKNHSSGGSSYGSSDSSTTAATATATNPQQPVVIAQEAQKKEAPLTNEQMQRLCRPTVRYTAIELPPENPTPAQQPITAPPSLPASFDPSKIYRSTGIHHSRPRVEEAEMPAPTPIATPSALQPVQLVTLVPVQQYVILTPVAVIQANQM